MHLPHPRGPASETVFACLRGPAAGLPPIRLPDDPCCDDFQILLWALQEMEYRAFDDVDPAWEREPWLRNLRDCMLVAYEEKLRHRVHVDRQPGESLTDAMLRLTGEGDGPSLSAWMAEQGTLAQLEELVIHRAGYQLQEADPYSFALPRLTAGRAKRALVKIQYAEYGSAEPNESHAELYRQSMDVIGVERDIDALPATTLRTLTVLNMFVGSRRLLGACIGHLAVFEMCSVEPMARYAAAVRRLVPEDVASKAARFYDVHVAADGLHQELALTELVGGFVEQYPDEADEVLFGASALMLLEGDLTEALLSAWRQGQSSLRTVQERAA